MSRRERERAQLVEIAERHPSMVRAVGAMVLLHERVDEPRVSEWRCWCRYQPALGEAHSTHVATEVLELQRRRGWLR